MADWFDHEPTEEEWRGAPMTTHDPQLDEIMQRYVAMPDCGACEDGEHEDCSHPKGMVQVAEDELAPICCCTDHPLVAVVADVIDESARLRAVLSALCDATDAVLDNYHYEHRQGCGGVPGSRPGDSDYCSVCDAVSALAAAVSVLQGEPEQP